MKTNFVKSILFVALAAGTLTSCVNDDDYSVPALECTEPEVAEENVISVEQLYNNATTEAVEYTQNHFIKAVVVSSDQGGNFYKTLFLNNIETNGQGQLTAGNIGFSVQINQASLFNDFYLGRVVYISLKDLYVQIRSNTLQIGALYNGNVGQIATLDYKNHVLRTCTILPEENLINVVTDLSSLDDSYIGRLVRLEGVQFTDNSLNQTYFNENNVDGGGQTLTYITDSEEETNTVPFRTSSFADYAGYEVSANNGTITGILTKFIDDYQFVSRYFDDIKLTEERIGDLPADPGTPFFTEDFQAAEHNTTFDFDGWYNIAEEGNWRWSEKVYQENGYVEFSAYNSGVNNVAWLITPAFDLDTNTNANVTFETAQHHLENDGDLNKLEVFVVTAFDGTDIVNATKVDITSQVALPTSSTSWYEFVNSGVIDLSGYTGNIHIAFKYTGTDVEPELSGAFQIDNFVMSSSN